ncbi:UNVERIFIED_CONTAM: Copia protein [Sesamum radiatum]|uniref:Copia protein n=1 Tax=Sesamum radiatum TaxID=300843 RepID=A0AAW2Q0A3_SESRA
MAMAYEMSALISRGTWGLVEPPSNADVVACRWVFTLKFRADRTLNRYKARLVAKGFTQTYRVLEHGLINSVVFLVSLGFRDAMQIIQSLSKRQDQIWPRYFLGFEIAHSKHEVYLSQRKYACDLLQEAGKTKYRRLVGKLIYLTVTRSDISCAVGLVIARSSAEDEYRAIAHTTSEVLWLKNLLTELGFMYDDPIPMHCDNQAVIHIVSNPILHEKTKHIEVDCHFIREAIMSQKISTPFTPSEQRAYIFTKAVGA